MLDVTKESPALDVVALRDAVRAIKEDGEYSWGALSKESGVAESTLQAFVSGTYRGVVANVAADVSRWLETRSTRERTAAVLPPPPGFMMTPTARDIFSALSFAQAAADFTVLIGAAGIGKTTALKAYEKRASNVWMITADSLSDKAATVVSVLAEKIGVHERRSAFLGRAVSARIAGTSGLVIVDEAQQLDTKAFDQLRTTVLDLGNCGLAVSGNESMLAKLQGSAGTRQQAFAQLHSRVGMKKPQHAAKPGDVAMLLDAWGFSDEKLRALLAAIARKSGALRIMNKVIQLAAFLADAGAAGAKGIKAEHIELAWKQLASGAIES